MDLIISVLTIVFIAVLIGTAFTFGAALLSVLLIFSVVMAGAFVLRQRVRRWLFVRNAQQRESTPQTKITIIETEYEDLTDKK